MKKIIFALFAMVITAIAMILTYLLTETMTGDIVGAGFMAMMVFMWLGTIFLCGIEEVR